MRSPRFGLWWRYPRTNYIYIEYQGSSFLLNIHPSIIKTALIRCLDRDNSGEGGGVWVKISIFSNVILVFTNLAQANKCNKYLCQFLLCLFLLKHHRKGKLQFILIILFYINNSFSFFYEGLNIWKICMFPVYSWYRI